MSLDDQIIMISSCASLVIFLFVHGVMFRFLKPEQLLNALMATSGAAGIFDMAIVWLLVNRSGIPLGGESVLVVILSLVILGLFLFVYVLCIFGPYETSIRMRLIRELSGDLHRGILLPDILSRYNSRMILDNRLKRLMGCGDVVVQQGVYRIQKHHNAFFLIDRIAQIINRLIPPNKNVC